MPFYEYECSNCKFYTEVLQKISDAPLTKCPSCGKEALKKLVSAPIFRLKGGGWYETDFKGDKENRRNLAGSDVEESSKTEAASDSASKASKAETPKAEPAKPQAPTAETSSRPASKSAGGVRSSAGAKASSGKSAGTGRTAKPASKVAASKARSAASVRSKAKASAGRKKKGRR